MVERIQKNPLRSGIMRHVGAAFAALSGGVALAGCDANSGPAYHQLPPLNRTLIGPETIPFTGVPPQASSLNPACTHTSWWPNLLKQVKVSSGFDGATIYTREGVEGQVTVTVEVGTTEMSGNCRTRAVITGQVYIDTKDTNCLQGKIDGDLVVLKCDGPGVVMDSNTRVPLAHIQGGSAVINTGENHMVSVYIRDPAGNTTEPMTLVVPTTCTQLQGAVKYNDETGMMELGINCDGPGILYVGDRQFEIHKGETWYGVGAGDPKTIDGKVDFQGRTTGIRIQTPQISPPQAQADQLSIEHSQVVGDVNCTTQLGNPCNVQVTDAEGSSLYAGQAGHISFPADITADERVVAVNVCDDFGGCATTPITGTIPAYRPFEEIDVDVATSDKGDKLIITVDHLDQTESLSKIDIQATQDLPMRQSRLGQEVLEVLGHDGTVTCSTENTRDVTRAVCPIKKHGDVHVTTYVSDYGGNKEEYHESIGMQDYPRSTQEVINAVPTGLALLAIGTVGVVTVIKVQKQRIERRVKRLKAAKVTVNMPGLPDEGQLKEIEHVAKKLPPDEQKMFQTIIEGKRVLQEIREEVCAEGISFATAHALCTYIDKFAGPDRKEYFAQLRRSDNGGYMHEIEEMGVELLRRLNEQLERVKQGGVVRRVPEEDAEQFIDSLIFLYSIDEHSWFTKTARKKIQQELQYPHLSKAELRRAIIYFYQEKNLLDDENMTKLFLLFNPGLDVVIRRDDIRKTAASFHSK